MYGLYAGKYKNVMVRGGFLSRLQFKFVLRIYPCLLVFIFAFHVLSIIIYHDVRRNFEMKNYLSKR